MHIGEVINDDGTKQYFVVEDDGEVREATTKEIVDFEIQQQSKLVDEICAKHGAH